MSVSPWLFHLSGIPSPGIKGFQTNIPLATVFSRYPPLPDIHEGTHYPPEDVPSRATHKSSTSRTLTLLLVLGLQVALPNPNHFPSLWDPAPLTSDTHSPESFPGWPTARLEELGRVRLTESSRFKGAFALKAPGLRPGDWQDAVAWVGVGMFLGTGSGFCFSWSV